MAFVTTGEGSVPFSRAAMAFSRYFSLYEDIKFMTKITTEQKQQKTEVNELSEKFLEYMEDVIRDDEEYEYPEYDDAPSSF
jgi:hypothetical protein